MRIVLLAPLFLIGCDRGEEDLTCRSMTSAAEQLTIEIAELGAGDFTPADPFTTGAGEVLRTDATWASATAAWGTDGGLSPDFAVEYVFVNRFSGDGCGGIGYDYAGWYEDGALRLVLVRHAADDLCDVDEDRLDLIQVPHRNAENIAWCAPE